MESEKYFHKNRCGAVTARLSVKVDENALFLKFAEKHKAAVISVFETVLAPAADLAYSKKSLKKPISFEVSYRFTDGKKPYLQILETIRSGREVILESEEKHRFLRYGKRLFYRGAGRSRQPNKMNNLLGNT